VRNAPIILIGWYLLRDSAFVPLENKSLSDIIRRDLGMCLSRDRHALLTWVVAILHRGLNKTNNMKSDRLTHNKDLTIAQTLGLVHDLVGNIKVDIEST